jgi:hypothetical protein
MSEKDRHRLQVKVTLLRESHPELFDRIADLSPRLRASKLRDWADSGLHQPHRIVQLVSAVEPAPVSPPAAAAAVAAAARPIPAAPRAESATDGSAARRALAAAFAANPMNQKAFSIDADDT